MRRATVAYHITENPNGTIRLAGALKPAEVAHLNDLLRRDTGAGRVVAVEPHPAHPEHSVVRTEELCLLGGIHHQSYLAHLEEYTDPLLDGREISNA